MMTIQDIIESRGIERIVHFTTNLGALGVLATRSLKARARLRDDELLANVAKLNAKDRSRDAKWHDFVNLSITNINTSLEPLLGSTEIKTIGGAFLPLTLS